MVAAMASALLLAAATLLGGWVASRGLPPSRMACCSYRDPSAGGGVPPGIAGRPDVKQPARVLQPGPLGRACNDAGFRPTLTACGSLRACDAPVEESLTPGDSLQHAESADGVGHEPPPLPPVAVGG